MGSPKPGLGGRTVRLWPVVTAARLIPKTQRFASIAPANGEDEAELGLCFSEMAPLPTIRALPCREIGLIIHC